MRNISDSDNFYYAPIKFYLFCFVTFLFCFFLGQKYALLLVKVTLAHLLRRYKVETTRRPPDYVLVAETTLKRKEGYMISLKPRCINNNIICK